MVQLQSCIIYAVVGVHPAEEYMFVVFVTPVGPYFKGGFSTNPYVIIREFDRAAPHGTGKSISIGLRYLFDEIFRYC